MGRSIDYKCNRLKCADCGRFISNKDFESGQLRSEDKWNWDKTELNNVYWFCLNCHPAAPKDFQDAVKSLNIIKKEMEKK